jgi:uncharacterized protein
MTFPITVSRAHCKAVSMASQSPSLYMVERVYPWTKTDYSRVGKQSKLFMVDSGLMTSLLSWKMDKVRLDSDRSGKLIETFAFNEIMAQVDAGDGRYELFHYRDREKREIDFLIEREDNALLGIEIKAGSAIGKKISTICDGFRRSLQKAGRLSVSFFIQGNFPPLSAITCGPSLSVFCGLKP